MIGSVESKPDFLVLVYPAIPKGIEVTASTRKTFLVHADDDRLSAGENSVRFYLALKKAGVNSEMHIYSGGGHGFGVKSTDKTSATWPQSFASWVRTL
jgi:dipeptidyl aminopeptidase/acylaminoacyl peptidase